MTEISRVALFGKLNKVGYQAVEGATVFCKMRGNPYVEIVHWLAQILQGQDNDILKIMKHYDLDPGRVAADMQKALDALPRGATSISDLSAHLEEAMERLEQRRSMGDTVHAFGWDWLERADPASAGDGLIPKD